MKWNCTQTICAATSAALLSGMLALAAGAQDAKGPVGDWDIVVDMNGTPVNATLSVAEKDDGTLTAQVASALMGEADVETITMEDDKINFSQTFGEGDTAMDVTFSGIFEGDAFSGLLTSPLGEMPVTGTRAKPAPAVAGMWDIKSDSQAGPLERTLKVNKDWTGEYIDKATEQSFPISNLAMEENTVTFDVTVSLQGQDLPLSFKGNQDGDALTGEFFMDGNSVSSVTGTRMKIGGLEALVGAWDLFVVTPIGDLENKLVVKEDGTGTYISEEESPITDLEVDGDFVSFHVTVTAQGTPYEVDFEGTLGLESLTGDFIMDGSPVGEIEGKPAADG